MPGSAGDFFQLKDSFSLHTVAKCLLTRGSSDCFQSEGSLCIIVGGLPYDINHLEATVVIQFNFLFI